MIPMGTRIFVCTAQVDMRKSFDGLAAAAQEATKSDPEGGALFVFANRRSNRLKVLWWDRTGYCLLYKRLEWGVFRLPAGNSSGFVTITLAELAEIIKGIGLPPENHRAYAKAVKDAIAVFTNKAKAST